MNFKMEQSQWTMCIQPAKPCGEPPNDVDIEIGMSKLKKWKSNWT